MGSPVFFYPLKGYCAVYLRRYLRRYKHVLPTGHLSFGLHLLRRIIARYINFVADKNATKLFLRLSVPHFICRFYSSSIFWLLTKGLPI